MHALILSMLVNVWCSNYMVNEYGDTLVWDEEQSQDYQSCLDNTVEEHLFDADQYTSFPDTRL